jgi:hypothetical protein
LYFILFIPFVKHAEYVLLDATEKYHRNYVDSSIQRGVVCMDVREENSRFRTCRDALLRWVLYPVRLKKFCSLLQSPRVSDHDSDTM